MTSQLNNLIAQQTQAELVSRAERGPKERDHEGEEMDDRGLAPEMPRGAPFPTRALPEDTGYRPLCAHGMNSLTDRAYHLALGRLS